MTDQPYPTGKTNWPLNDALRARFNQPDFPRASRYDPDWVLDNEMGPNVLWLTEWATGALDLQPGMKVLGLGCGKALSSMFLAREFGVQVTAADLWIAQADNEQRVLDAGLSDMVTPVHAEAHQLPFDAGEFDVIISIDSYHYFGTADLYIGYITQFLKPGGTICIVTPSVTRELPDGPPDHLQPWWVWEFCCFHTADWWAHHWAKSGLVTIEDSSNLPDGWRLWRDWCEICATAGCGLEDGAAAAREIDMLNADGGDLFCFARTVGRKG